MKHSKTIVGILSFLVLTGCNGGMEPNCGCSNTSFGSSMNVDLPVDKDIPDIEIGQAITNYYYPATANISYDFTLSEFGENAFKTFRDEQTTKYNIFYCDRKIIEDVNDSQVYAADINKDGYRELITFAYSGDYDSVLVVYDAYNSRELLRKDFYKESIPGLCNPISEFFIYHYFFKIINNRLALIVYNGSRSDVNYDYAYFNYSPESGVTLELQNMYDIDHVSLLSVRESDNEANNHTDGDKKIYSLNKGVQYVIDYEVIRKPNADLNKVVDSFAGSPDKFPSQGTYVLYNDVPIERHSQNVTVVKGNNNTNGFGNYALKFTLPNNAEGKGIIKICYCGFSTCVYFKVVD